MKKILEKSWLFILGLLILTTIACWFILTDHLLLNIICSIITVIVFVIYAFPKREYLYLMATSRFSQKLYSHLLSVLLIFCIFGALSYMAYQNPIVFDITKQNANTLSDKTRKVLDLLSGTVRVELYASTEDRARFLQVLNLYRIEKHDLEISFIDIAREPAKAQAAGIKAAGDVLLYYKAKKVMASASDELKLTNGLFKLTQSKQIRIKLTQGHSELNLSSTGEEGIKNLLSSLEHNNYLVETIDLSQQQLSSETDLLFILGPKQDFLDRELQRLNEYMQAGGKIFLAIDPIISEESNLKNLRSWLKKSGLIIRNNMVLDRLSTLDGIDPSILLISSFSKEHKITNGLQGRFISPLTSSIEYKQLSEDDLYVSLLISNNFPACWGETNLVGLSKGKAVFDDGDKKGPLTVMSILEKVNGSQILLLGSSRPLLDGYKNQSININLVMNAVNYMVGEQGIISLNRPGMVQERLFISNTQMSTIFYLSVICIPLLLFGFAVYFYRKRVMA